MQESDNLMLAFYEGGDCMIEEDEPPKPLPEPTPSVAKPPPISSRPTPSSSNQPPSSFKPHGGQMLPDPVRTTSNMFLSHLNNPNTGPRNMTNGPSPVTHIVANHPIQAVFEYNRRMNNPPPKFMERWGPGGGWAFDIELGPVIYSCPWFSPKKKEAKAEACKYALSQLGVKWGSQYDILNRNRP